MDGVISRILISVDDGGREFVSTVYEKLGSEMGGIFRLMLIVYVIWWGLNVMAGRESVSPIEAAYRLGRAFVIYWFVTNWDAFSVSIYQLVQSVPEEVGKAVMQSVSSIGGGSGSTDPTAIGQVFDTMYEQSKQIANQVYTGSYMDIFGAILALLILLVVLFFTAIAVAAIVAAKIMLFIILALTPIWIILALYRWSSRYWEGFIVTASNLIIQQILIYGFLGFYSNLVTRALNTAVNGGDGITGKVAYVLPLVLVTLIGTYVLSQIPSLSSMLAGGGMVGTIGAGGSAVANAMTAGRAARSTGRGVGRGAAAGGRAIAGIGRRAIRGRQETDANSRRQEAMRSLIAANARRNAAPLS